MSDNLLVLVPADPESPHVTPVAIRARLRACGFLSESATIFGAVHELPGFRFAELLRFTPPLAPSRLTAPHTVELVTPTSTIEFLGGADTETPSCPSCGFLAEDWPDILSSWHDGKATYRWACPKCKANYRPWQLNWQGWCAFGKQQVNIWHIGYRQAHPSPELQEEFNKLGSGPWAHFFYHL